MDKHFKKFCLNGCYLAPRFPGVLTTWMSIAPAGTRQISPFFCGFETTRQPVKIDDA